MKRTILFLISLCVSLLSFSQEAEIDTLNRKASIAYDAQGNLVSFKPETPPLYQKAGAPKAYYSYYWEFGDGHFSTQKEPQHTYQKKGDYAIRLWATNYYDNGKTPTTRPNSVSVKSTPDDAEDTAFMTEDIQLRKNRDPIPEEEIVVVMSYKNPKQYVTEGKLYLFYNEKKYKADNFKTEDIRNYHGEKITDEMPAYAAKNDFSSEHTWMASNRKKIQDLRIYQQDTTEKKDLQLTLMDAKEKYKNHQTIEFGNLQPNEERNIFFTLRTTQEMLKDTSAIISVRSIYVPDDNYDNHKVKDLEMEIVNSHDPNKMSSNATVMNYRLVRLKTFKFKVQFQNNGDGPASTVQLKTDIPEMFDISTLKIIDQYPECTSCPKEKKVNYSCIDTTRADQQAIFTFKNIYLPGSQQKNVTDIDSTKGFVKYSIKLKESFHKQKTTSKTAIIFDKNEPIITNTATTRFLPGISIGAKAGMILSPDLDNHNSYFIGATISPFKSYRGYFQAELMLTAESFDEFKDYEKTEREGAGTNASSLFLYEEENDIKNFGIHLVPASYRYNINNFLAVGAGLELKMNLTQKVKNSTTAEHYLYYEGEDILFRDESKDISETSESKNQFTDFQAGVFAGFNIGGARIGPSVGARYVYYYNTPDDHIQLYALWKF
ncbi:MAG: PKD domain-containing protein [Flavobacteriaceae bacterium]